MKALAWVADVITGAVGLLLLLVALFGEGPPGSVAPGVMHIALAAFGALLIWRGLQRVGAE